MNRALTPTALPAALGDKVAPLYHVFGPEILLVEEAADHIRRHARDLGFSERIRLHVEPGFDWQHVTAAAQARSLFAERKIIEVRMPGAKPGEAGARTLIQYAGATFDDTTLLLIGGAMDKRAQATKWFTATAAVGVTVECRALPAAQLPAWARRRMTAAGLECTAEAVTYLCHHVEGNLLAASQAIDLLALLSPPQPITVTTVQDAIADHARFNVYAFVDACLAGSAARSARILQSLRREHTEPILILWALTRETRTMCQLAAALAGGGNASAVFKRHGVWSSRAELVRGALGRLPGAHWEKLLYRLARADLMLKGRAELLRENIWEEIESIGLGMCGLGRAQGVVG